VRQVRPERKNRFFVYVHTNGSTHLKKFSEPEDITEMCASSFVKEVYEVTEDQWNRLRQPLNPEERAAVILAGGKIDPRLVGMVQKLKG
jgi:hypothetical protein